MKNRCVIVNDDNKIYILEKYDNNYEAEAAINLFATLVKAPVGVHTYQLDDYSLWSAAAMGFRADDIIDKIQNFSRNFIPIKVISYIKKIVKQFWTVKLYIGDELTLKVNNIEVMFKLMNSKLIKELLIKENDEETLIFNIKDLSKLKEHIINLNIFIEEINGDYKWMSLNYKVEVKLYEYQKRALDKILNKNKNFQCARGVITMPPGTGKTILGLKVIEKLKVKTLILVKNEESYKNWVEEISDKTNLSVSNISIQETKNGFINIFTYDKAVKELNGEEFQKKWGLIIYDDARELATKTRKKTAYISSRYKLAMGSLLDRPSEEMRIYKVIGPRLFNLTISEMEKVYGQIPVKCKCVKLEPDYWENKIKDSKIHYAAKNLKKITVLRKIIDKYDNVILVSHFIDVSNKFAHEFNNIKTIDGNSKIEERDEIVTNFNNKVINKLIVTQIIEKLPLVNIDALISVSYRGVSIRDEYIRIGKIKSSNKLFCKKTGYYYALITKDTVEDNCYSKVMREMIKHGYNYNILKL